MPLVKQSVDGAVKAWPPLHISFYGVVYGEYVGPEFPDYHTLDSGHFNDDVYFTNDK